MPAPALRAPSAAPVLWAHRGASAFAAENTHAAFALAIEHGADGVELDVRDAACGTVVVVHDPTLARVAAGHRGVVAAMTAAELGAVDLVAPDGSRTRGVPRLDDALDQVLAAGLALNIEIKGDVPDRMRLSRRVLRVLHRRSARERERIVISTFRPEILLAMRVGRAGAPLGFLFDAENTGRYRAAALVRAIRPDGVHPQFRLADRGSVQAWKRRGLFVNVWTVDDEECLRILASHGVDGLITNDPRRARAALAAVAAR